MNEPLAYKMRPKKLKEIVGQKHLVGKDKVVYNMVKNKKIFSMILYGKPGIGKTSIAYAIAGELNHKIRYFNAVINNKKDFDIIIEEAKMYSGLILILDEVHRLNKDKQDLLLPHLESGLITIIGMTTANPYHSINASIRSRCQIFELNELEEKDIVEALKSTIKKNILEGLIINDDTIKYIAKISSGDLRYAYNLLEIAFYSSKDKKVTINEINNLNTTKVSNYSEGEYYDLLSAFQKSIRGSDVNASLHYLCRLLESGDYESIYRRMTVCAYEDIGLANPGMGPKVMACIDACERVGMPELVIPLSVVIIELALSPKSNSAYLAINNAFEDLKKESNYNVPKNINSKAQNYKYPHDYENAWVEQQYLPEILKNKKYYIPKTNSKYEKLIKDMYDKYNKK